MQKYELISEPMTLEGQNYIAYGISASDGTRIRDISNSKSFVMDILKTVNKADVSPCQLKDVVEDFLY